VPSRREAASLYGRAAAGYGQADPDIYRTLGRRLVDRASLMPGDRVLDVGTGRGAALFPAAGRLQVPRRVLGFDIAFPMVELVRDDAISAGYSDVKVAVMAAEDLGLASESFDVVLAAFVVFWFSDEAAAFANLRRVLARNGRLWVSTTAGRDERWDFYPELLAAYDRREPFWHRLSGGNGLNQNPGALAAALSASGFTEVTHRYETLSFRYESSEHWWQSLWTHGARRPLDAMSSPLLGEFKEAALSGAERLAEPDGSLIERWPVVFTNASVPA